MITTLYFIQLIAFQVCYVTSGQVKCTDLPVYLHSILRHKQTYRIIGIALMVIASMLFIMLLGWMSGLCASIIGLMGNGSLVVLLNPFRYLNEKAVAMLYVFFLMLEFLV